MRVKFLASGMARLALVFALVSVPVTAQDVEPAVTGKLQWSPVVDFDNQLFPAAILALATRHVENLSPTYLGDPNGMLGVRIVSPTAGVRISVSIKVDGLIDETSFKAVIPEANRQYEIFPPMRFDSRALARIQEPFTATALFSVSAESGSLNEQTRTVQVRSVNDVPFLYRTPDGRATDLSFLFAAFVDENHPWIDGVLSEALKWHAIRQFIGYQGTAQDVIQQVFAIWNVLQRREIRYSSITQPSGESETVVSQHVRFLDETIRYSQGNCVDGTVLFASVLRKIGLSPLLVLKPDHMFLGFYVSPGSSGQGRNWMFLETTAIGNPGLNSLQRGWKFLTEDGYKGSASYQQFVDAINLGNQEFQSMGNNLRAHQPGYEVIDVARARRSGISAIPRF